MIDFFFGVDPDLHTTAIAILRRDGREAPYVLGVTTADVPKALKGRAAVPSMIAEIQVCDFWRVPSGLPHGCRFFAAVESQQVYLGKAYKAADLVALATVAGAAAAAASRIASSSVALPFPHEWKGNVPKAIHQARVMSRLGIPYERRGSGDGAYVVPTLPASANPDGIAPAAFRHVSDAIGLAAWLAEKTPAIAT